MFRCARRVLRPGGKLEEEGTALILLKRDCHEQRVRALDLARRQLPVSFAHAGVEFLGMADDEVAAADVRRIALHPHAHRPGLNRAVGHDLAAHPEHIMKHFTRRVIPE